MLSLVTGKTTGVSKKVKPIIVRLPAGWSRDGNTYRGFTINQYISALGEVLDDLGLEHREEASCVVLLAQNYPRHLFTDDEQTQVILQMWGMIDELTKRGAIVVTGAGKLQTAFELRPITGRCITDLTFVTSC